MPPRPRFSSDVKVCQVGFLPSETKFALLTAKPAIDVVVRDASSDAEVFTATAGVPVFDNDSGEWIGTVDFTGLDRPGTYYIDAPGLGASHDFRIGDDIFTRAFRLAMRSYYGQRCGMAVDMAPDFPQYKHAACHPGPAAYDKSSGRSGGRLCAGGWHDAGDYNRYVVNSSITVATLMWAYDLNQPNLRGLRLDIPESAGPIPDMLAEIRYNLEWMMSMQDDIDGGVWHKATSAEFCGFIMPEDDDYPVLIVGSGDSPFKTTASTADLAAVCAIAARLYGPFDADFAARCLDVSLAAWEWLEAHPEGFPFSRNPEGIHTGQYEDDDVRDEPVWAAAELYRTTGEARFNSYFVDHYAQWKPLVSPDIGMAWDQVQALAMFSYISSGRADANATAINLIRSALASAADELVARAQKDGYRTPMRREDYVWGSNSFVANYAVLLLMANHFAPNPIHFNAAQDCLHYLLGRNTFNTSFLTHVGTRWAMSPHHRPSIADGIEEPWPGLLMGGPRATEATPPARQWVDYWGDASRNENAINWNAPLVFMLAEALPKPRA